MEEVFQIKKLSEHLFLIKENYEYTANILIRKRKDSLFMVDGGFYRVAKLLKEFIDQYFGLPIEMIAVSHDHGDHMGLNKLISEHATLVIHWKGKFSLKYKEIIRLKGRKTIRFGEMIKIFPIDGGHSTSDILIYLPESNVAYLGDIYLAESFPLIGVSTGNSARVLLERLKDIRDYLPRNTILIPGHGKTTNMNYFDKYITMLEETIDLVINEKLNFKSIRDIQKMDVLKGYEKWGEYFEFVTKNSWIEDIYLSYK